VVSLIQLLQVAKVLAYRTPPQCSFTRPIGTKADA